MRAMDVCPHCGAPLPRGSTFCPRCQTSLLAPVVAAPGSLGAQQNQRVRCWEWTPGAGAGESGTGSGGAAGWCSSLAGVCPFQLGGTAARSQRDRVCGRPNARGLPDDASNPPTPQLYSIHPDGTGLHQLTNTTNISYLSPSWSPDGSHLAALELADNQAAIAHLVVMDADGLHAHVISAAALHLDLFSEGSPTNVAIDSQLIAWSPDGNQLVVPVSSGQYMLVNADGTNPHTFAVCCQRGRRMGATWAIMSQPRQIKTLRTIACTIQLN